MVSALMVRVGVDSSAGGGSWNAPVDGECNEFAYVPIPEGKAVQVGMERPYTALDPVLATFGITLPESFRTRHMHLDPDFEHLTYGDQGERAKQLRSNVGRGDLIVFYAGLADVQRALSR